MASPFKQALEHRREVVSPQPIPAAADSPFRAALNERQQAGASNPGDIPSLGAPTVLSAGDVARGAVKNFVPSAKQFGADILSLVTDPVGTAEGIYNVGVGAAQKLIPGEQGKERYADAVGEFFADRYGGLEELKNTMATDPVGFLADATTVLTGGAGLAARAPGAVGRIAKVASNAASAVDPVSLATRGVNQAVKGITAARGAKVPSNKQFVADAPSTEALHQQGSKLYKAADASGATFPQADFSAFAGKLSDRLKSEGVDSVLHPKVARIAKLVEDSAGEAPNLTRMEILRRQFGDAAASTDAAERRLGQIGIEMVDDFVEAGASSASGTLKEARSLWRRMRKAETIEGAIENASLAKEGVEAGLRNQFSTLYRQRNKKKMRGFSKAEIAAIKAVATGNFSANVLRRIGSLSGGTGAQRNLLNMLAGSGLGGAAGATVGGPLGGFVGAVGVPAVGHGAQRLAERGTRGRAELVRAMAATGRTPKKGPPPSQAGLPPEQPWQAGLPPDVAELVRAMAATGAAPSGLATARVAPKISLPESYSEFVSPAVPGGLYQATAAERAKPKVRATDDEEEKRYVRSGADYLMGLASAMP